MNSSVLVSAHFRAERRRRTWTLPIEAAFRVAVHRQAARDVAERKMRRKRRPVS